MMGLFGKLFMPFLFMSFTNDWDATAPADHTKFKVQPSHVRDVKTDLGERLAAFFYGFTTGETDTGCKLIKALVQTTAPSTATDSVWLYAKDVSSTAEWFIKDEAGNEIQLTSGGKINLSASILPNDTYLVAKDTTGSGTVDLIKANSSNLPCLGAGVVVDGTADPASDYAVATKKYVNAQSKRTIFWFLAGVQGIGTNVSAAIRLPFSGTITKARMRAKTAPTGASLIADINIDGTSIWASTQANRVTVAASGTYGDQTSFDTVAYTAEQEITVDLDQVGSSVAGADVTIMLDIQPS